MEKIIKVMKSKNILTGYLYFYIHLITEIACFYMLNKITNGSMIVWLIPFVYDDSVPAFSDYFDFFHNDQRCLILLLPKILNI